MDIGSVQSIRFAWVGDQIPFAVVPVLKILSASAHIEAITRADLLIHRLTFEVELERPELVVHQVVILPLYKEEAEQVRR